MTIREQIEKREQEILSPFACLSINSRGRDYDEPQCDIRPVFQRDRDRILHSKAFRRLKNKTQVFLTPKGDHYRTRMSHTLEVSQNARTIAKALRLNEDLVEAIALGHDLGHTPFGHAGERILNEIYEGGFKHNEQSVRAPFNYAINKSYTVHSFPSSQASRFSIGICSVTSSCKASLYTSSITRPLSSYTSSFATAILLPNSGLSISSQIPG